jgi:hypothetical protein
MKVFGHEVLKAMYAGAGLNPPSLGGPSCRHVGLALAELAVERSVKFADEFLAAMHDGDVDSDEAVGVAWDIVKTAKGKRSEQQAILDRMYQLIGEVEARLERPIAPPRKVNHGKTVDWSGVPLGKKSDREIARDIGVSRGLVQRVRTDMGIPAFGSRPPINWDAQPLGLMSDGKIAALLGVSDRTVQAQRQKRGIKAWSRSRIDWDRQPLGEKPDSWIADDLCVCKATVRNARVRLGIPAHKPPRPDIESQPLGRIPDAWIARRIGVSAYTVRRHRCALHIPASSFSVTQMAGER